MHTALHTRLQLRKASSIYRLHRATSVCQITFKALECSIVEQCRRHVKMYLFYLSAFGLTYVFNLLLQKAYSSSYTLANKKKSITN